MIIKNFGILYNVPKKKEEVVYSSFFLCEECGDKFKELNVYKEKYICDNCLKNKDKKSIWRRIYERIF
jgi:hypothetical protein